MAMRMVLKLQGLALAAGLMMLAAAPAGVRAAGDKETVMRIQDALGRLPYYGVFDLIAFTVERGTATLSGYAYRGGLPSEAAAAVKRLPGVDDVVNRIELLPPSQLDEEIRLATFAAVYGDDHFSRYIPGGAHTVRYDFNLFARFANMQPVGMYPIHIIVKNLRTTLFGEVDTELDRTLAATRARSVPGVLKVEVEIAVSGGKRK